MKKRIFEVDFVYISLLLFVVVLVSFYMTSSLYAKYTTGAETSDSARVAVFDASFDNPLETTFDVRMYPNSSEDSQSLIINSVNNSEVSMRFNIEIKEDGNIPLTITGVSPLVQDSTDSNVWYYIAPPSIGNQALGITVAWDPTQIGYEYSGGVAHVTLKVYAEQVD